MQTELGSFQRHLASLKLISRLLGHELHAQGGSQTLTLTREEVLEIQTAVDLFIEQAGRRASGGVGLGSDPMLVPTRN